MKTKLTIICLLFLMSVNGWAIPKKNVTDAMWREETILEEPIDWRKFCEMYGHCWVIKEINENYNYYPNETNKYIGDGIFDFTIYPRLFCKHCGVKRKKIVKEEWVEEK